MNRFLHRQARMLVLAGVALAWSANATAPISYRATDIWKRSVHGAMYASTKDNQLVALCIEAGGVGNWLPSSAIEGISLPNLEEMQFMQGLALSRSEEFVPDWGMDSLGLMLETSIIADERGNLEEGPSYFFVIDKKRIAYRVRQEWIPDPSGRVVATQESTWTTIAAGDVRHAPCSPPR